MADTCSDPRRWTQLIVLAVVELLAMSLWFSATAVTPALQVQWDLSDASVAWLTISVQLGFVAGALASAVFNLSERFAPPRMMAACALLGAGFNLAICGLPDDVNRAKPDFVAVVALRMLTGVMLAGVYPTGMKLMATWFVRGRGLAIGVLVGALTVGSAAPHLYSALVTPLDQWSRAHLAGWPAWRLVLASASASALVSSIIAAIFLRTGPNLPATTKFDWRYFARAWTEPALRRANFGYLGHMFELYAMWAWAPRALQASYFYAGGTHAQACLAGFATVAVGGIGCVLAGLAADRIGRSWTTIVSLAISGSCALIAGGLIAHPVLLTAVCLLWGFAVVADSAQFSAAVSELCDPQFVGTALTIQTCAGFLLTTLTIRAVPAVESVWGWQAAFALLAAGPIFGIYHMARLRILPEASRMAGGRR